MRNLLILCALVFLTAFALGLLLVEARAVDCKMARQMAASFTLAQLKTMGTKQQRAEYAPCFKRTIFRHKKKRVK